MNNYKQHQALLKKFKIAFQRKYPNSRILDQPVGLFFTRNGAPVKVGKNGQADLTVLFPTKKGILYLQYEIKSNSGRQSKKQKLWQEMIENMNGFYIIVRENFEETFKETERYLVDKGFV